ncbi:uncharacterized protein LOC117818238 isoform X1 [Notolabrus celidotus]|uniref:uncharacterized protein LOC117818238 isoform X1 n=1 Tax=Notolabrus celidotus TaxID=1203425 RepID=UPI0014905DAD|nr:uncharacterized protein LOC117818238 isoform X1 [Notolabrus celidotus]
MDAIFDHAHDMRPSSFSEEEQHHFHAEKILLKQFMLMKQQDEVPDSVSVGHMKSWLLKQRSFLNEIQGSVKTTGTDDLSAAELAYNLMEEELLEQLEREKQLSLLFNRNVSLKGLQRFITSIRPGAEKVVQFFLPSLHRKLLQMFLSINIPRDGISAGDPIPVDLLELEQFTAPVVPQVVDSALKLLLENPEQVNREEAANAEISQLLMQCVVPYLSCHVTVNDTLVLGVCKIMAKFMVKAIKKNIDMHSKYFEQMDENESCSSARDKVITAIRDMTEKAKTDTSSRAHIQISNSHQAEDSSSEKRGTSLEAVHTEENDEGLVEKREASPQVSLDEVMATIQEDVTEDRSMLSPDTCLTPPCYDGLEDLQQSAISDIVPSEDITSEAEHQLQEKRGASPQVTATEELEKTLLEKREASSEDVCSKQEGLIHQNEALPPVSKTEETATMTKKLMEDTPLVSQDTHVTQSCDDQNEEERQDDSGEEVQASSGEDTDHKVQPATSQVPIEQISTMAAENRPVEERGPSPQVTATDELEKKTVEEKEMSSDVSATNPENITGDKAVWVRVETNVSVFLDTEIEIIQEGIVESSEIQDALSVNGKKKKKKKKKKGVKAFFRGAWKSVTSCLRSSTEE